ncbi:PREDICTED: homeobox-leucine zipper protein HDG1 isoform X3 [Camelina sativa]|uniref:Homeobox-leucine zipper protein HDG1 isoform X3 n=1 Tax=Camelina sativa TaxID=90675 RepID=A0ABM0WCD0_CAMSA|nr:PREDICTED: homeobox-leucine zipper protein HDG1 isoform X3 [Camelina sativa]
MNFNGFLDNTSSGVDGAGASKLLSDVPYNNNHHFSFSAVDTMLGTTAAITPSLHSRTPNSRPFSSHGLSLGLTNGEMSRNGEVLLESNVTREKKTSRGGGEDVTTESRSESDNAEAVSGDDLDTSDDRPPFKKKKRYHRHTPKQIQDLESVFKECAHPDEKQRLDLSRRLNLDPRQVKFWFQNRRTQMKTQIERHENALLRQENDKLRAENMSVREAMRNPMCGNCGGPAVLADISMEEQHLRIENSRLKDELDRVCALTGKFLGRSNGSHYIPDSALVLGVGVGSAGCNGGAGGGGFTLSSPRFEISNGTGSGLASVNHHQPSVSVSDFDHRSRYLDLALAAMDELVNMAQTRDPLWVRSSDTGFDVLNREEYDTSFSRCVGPKPDGFVSEASKESGTVIINSLALVETLMDSERWAEMFPSMISRTSTTEIISSGMGGTRNGALHLMQAEFQLLSPLVPVRQVSFLRFCKQHAEGVWAVVDVSIDSIREGSSSSCRRLPSGCLVQDMANGYSKVTWIEHTEYDENRTHRLYRPLLSCGLAFGAHRWMAALQRQCECLTILMSSTVSPSPSPTPINCNGRKSMLKLAKRMTDNFCGGVCASSLQKWSKLNVGNVDEDVRIMTRKSVNIPGEPPGIVLNAATSVWMPVSPRRLFDFLGNEGLRSEWDILSNGGPMKEMAHIAKGHDHSNSVSLLRASAVNANQSSMLILQETSIDAAGALVVYAPVDIPAMQAVMNGGDSAYVALLPSGFAILPNAQAGTQRCATEEPNGNGNGNGNGGMCMEEGGSLLTVAFQILVNSLPTAKLTVESVETVNNLISCTVQMIKAALHCDST